MTKDNKNPRNAGRKRMPACSRRVKTSCYVHPKAKAKIQRIMDKHGLSEGKAIDKLAGVTE